MNSGNAEWQFVVSSDNPIKTGLAYGAAFSSLIGETTSMMGNSLLWTENEVLREKLKEIQKLYENEREQRLKLQAENLWMKRVLREDFGQPSEDRSKKWVV